MTTQTEIPLLDKLEEAIHSFEDNHPWTHKLGLGQMCQTWLVDTTLDIVLKSKYQKIVKEFAEEWGKYLVRIRLNSEWEKEDQFSAVCSIVSDRMDPETKRRKHVVLFRTKSICPMWVKLFETPCMYSKYGNHLHSKEQHTVYESLYHEKTMMPSEVRKFIRENHPDFVEHFDKHPYLVRDLARYHNAAIEADDPKYIGVRTGVGGHSPPRSIPGHRIVMIDRRYYYEQTACRGGKTKPKPRPADPILDNIAKMIPNGTRLELPKKDHFKNYQQVKSVLQTAGGKYKDNGFEFGKDAAEIQARLLGGEKVNDKKKYQFFETPKGVCDLVHQLAEIKTYDRVLEPSAGRGALLNDLDATTNTIHCVELWDENREWLEAKGYKLIGKDFLEVEPDPYYDRIVANPPFTNNQDIDHIRHMYKFLLPGGKLVSVASRSWKTGSQKKQKEFREWLLELDAHITYLGSGEFKSSGTNIETCIITIEKK